MSFTFKWCFLIIGLPLLVACVSGSPPRQVYQAEPQSPPPLAAAMPISASVQLDGDGDGVLDKFDTCPDSSPNALVDAVGCDVSLGAIAGLKFEPNEAKLSVDTRVVLSRLVDVFLRYPEVVFSVDGHTDNRGPAAANLELSKERVLAVVRYMVANGISPDRIKPFGYGESRPRAPNATAEGREQNRRIEINVVDRLPLQ